MERVSSLLKLRKMKELLELPLQEEWGWSEKVAPVVIKDILSERELVEKFEECRYRPGCGGLL